MDSGVGPQGGFVAPHWSPDGFWWWDGVGWRPARRQSKWWRRPPRWERRDTIALVIWLVTVPLVLATVPVAVGVANGWTATVFWVSVGMLPLWAFAGGLLVRPRAPWWEVPILGTGLLWGLVVLYVVSMAATDTGSNSNDTAAGAGAVLIVVTMFVPFNAMAALGRLVRRLRPQRPGPAVT